MRRMATITRNETLAVDVAILSVSGLAPFGFCVSGLNGVADFETREESVYDTRRIGHRQVNV